MSKKQGGSSKGKLLLMLVSALIVLVVVIGCGTKKEDVAKQTPQPPTQAPATQTGDKVNNSHSKMNVNCNQCHAGADTTKKPTTDQCLTCHKSQAEVALKTADKKPNPHGPHHYDTADCTVCHSVHAKSQMICATCHDFTWMKDLGDSWDVTQK